MKFIKKFKTHDTDYLAYMISKDKILPNLSYCEDIEDVHLNKSIENRLIIKYKVSDDSELTQLYNYSVDDAGSLMFNRIEIDGSSVNISEIDNNYGQYQLSNGEHTVKYTLKDNTIMGFVYDESSQENIMGVTFSGCELITEVIIPYCVTTIGDETFAYCENINSIIINATNPPIIQGDPFQDIIDTVIYIPHESINEYINSESWNDYISDQQIQLADKNFYSTETKIIGKFNVTNINNPTKILYSSAESKFSEIEIDGVIQPNVITTYQFNTVGEHIIKYTPINSTTLENDTLANLPELINLIIPNNIKIIKAWAISSNQNLTDITFGTGNLQLNSYSIMQSNLLNITVHSFRPQISYVFNDLPDQKIYVPNYCIDMYKESFSEYENHFFEIQ